MFCPKCGIKVTEKIKFCPKCGEVVKQEKEGFSWGNFVSIKDTLVKESVGKENIDKLKTGFFIAICKNKNFKQVFPGVLVLMLIVVLLSVWIKLSTGDDTSEECIMCVWSEGSCIEEKECLTCGKKVESMECIYSIKMGSVYIV